jgi:hypothetical protein
METTATTASPTTPVAEENAALSLEDLKLDDDTANWGEELPTGVSVRIIINLLCVRAESRFLSMAAAAYL